MSKFRHFSEMAQSLRAGAASGMDAQITLEPDSAISLAEILEAHEERLIADLHRELADSFRADTGFMGKLAIWRAAR